MKRDTEDMADQVTTALHEKVAGPGLATVAPPARSRARLLALGDVVALWVAFAISVLGAAVLPGGPAAPLVAVVLIGVLGTAVWVILFALYGLYDTDSRHLVVTSFDETGRIFPALLVGALGLLLVDQVLRIGTDVRILSATQATIFVLVGLGAAVVARGSLRSWVFPRIFPRGRALVVGIGPDARYLTGQLAFRREYGVDVVGYLADGNGAELPNREGMPEIVGSIGDIAELVDALDVDRIILTSSGPAYEEALDVVRTIRRPDLQVSILPRYFEVFTPQATLDDVAGTPLVNLPPLRLGSGARLVKRALDLVVAATLSVVLAPFLLAITVAVRLDSPGPALYRQDRRGRDGSVFRIAKFRTMRVDADRARADLDHLNESDGPLFKIKTGRDPRVTRVGGFLRRWSLDELPQLLNVLRGEMSLVGPRPFVLPEADRITGWAARRLDMTPGVTGPWQALGRNDLPYEEMIKLDYLYATNWSLWWDLRIIYQTVLAVLARRGAY